MLVPETEIIVTKDGAEILRKTVRPGDYVIGREPACDVQIEVELVSRRHAQLTVNFDHALIEDLGSSNGTLVNGQPITEATRLWPNQKIQIGAATIEIHRLKAATLPDVSLAPQTAAVQRLLPEEFLRDRKYDIGKVVAQDGMGAILDAREATTERRVAMKVMLDGSSPDDLSRFIAEAKVTAQLEHPSIVPVYELSVDENGQPFYTMKMVRGITLRKVLELLAEGVAETVKKYPLPALLTVFQKVCDALAFAHSKGVIHRDLKPENIMLDDFGVVLVMDWGLAKVISQKQAPVTDVKRSFVRTIPPETSGATIAGTVMGTPQYMSPEQARGEIETLDARSDIYALGTILYQILSLRPPVSGDDAWAIVEKVAKGEVEPLTNKATSKVAAASRRGSSSNSGGTPLPQLPHCPGGRIPDSLAAVVRKAMAFDKAARYAHVASLQRDIEAYQNGFATSAEKAGLGKQVVLLVKRHKGLFGAAAAAWLIITALAAWFVISVTHERDRANASLIKLRATAPTFHEQAKLLTEQEQLPKALEKIDIALALNPIDPGFHTQRGHILQSMERFDEAAKAYGDALRAAPDDPAAKANLELSRSLAKKKAVTGVLNIADRLEWRNTLQQQGRNAEAIFASRGLESDGKKMLPVWQAKLDGWLGKNAPRIILFSSGFYNLNLSNQGITDLTPLRGMPISTLTITGDSQIKDLTPLTESPLTDLYASGIGDLADLAPLRGKDLGTLNISYSKVSNLDALAGMKNLRDLQMGSTPIGDLTPIRNARLKKIIAWGTKIRSLEPLRGQPLEFVELDWTQVESLAPLAEAPLEVLDIENCSKLDLASLKTRRLRWLFAAATALDHLEVLGEMQNLEAITLPRNLTDFSLLRQLPHLKKIGRTSFGSVSNQVDRLKDAAAFWKEYDAQQKEGALAFEALQKMGVKDVTSRQLTVGQEGLLKMELKDLPINDLSPLAGLPIASLTLTLDGMRIADLSPLQGMPLVYLTINGALAEGPLPTPRNEIEGT